MRGEKYGLGLILLVVLCGSSIGCERAFDVKVTNKSTSKVEVLADEYSLGKVEPGRHAVFNRGANDTTLSFAIKSQGGKVVQHRITDEEKSAGVGNSMTYDLTWDGKTLAGPEASR